MPMAPPFQASQSLIESRPKVRTPAAGLNSGSCLPMSCQSSCVYFVMASSHPWETRHGARMAILGVSVLPAFCLFISANSFGIAACVATGLAIMEPGISRVCAVCGKRCLRRSELEAVGGEDCLGRSTDTSGEEVGSEGSGVHVCMMHYRRSDVTK